MYLNVSKSIQVMITVLGVKSCNSVKHNSPKKEAFFE